MIGKRIGNYEILFKLGQGGMGAVYEAVHATIGRRAAIKILHADLCSRPEFTRRFLNEARAGNLVRHPGVVSVYELGQLEDGTAYIIMEYLQGDTLHERLQTSKGRLDTPTLIDLARQMASVLSAVHAQGIVHRDLKPTNVMLVPDPEMPHGERVKIVDFGVAKMGSTERPSARPLTPSGIFLGTPKYMAPEQCQNACAVDAKADVYSMGTMLYQCLVGRPPFTGQGLKTLRDQLLAEVTPLKQLAPQTPLRLAALIHAMLAKDPVERPPMSQVAAELELLGASKESLAASSRSLQKEQLRAALKAARGSAASDSADSLELSLSGPTGDLVSSAEVQSEAHSFAPTLKRIFTTLVGQLKLSLSAIGRMPKLDDSLQARDSDSVAQVGATLRKVSTNPAPRYSAARGRGECSASLLAPIIGCAGVPNPSAKQLSAWKWTRTLAPLVILSAFTAGARPVTAKLSALAPVAATDDPSSGAPEPAGLPPPRQDSATADASSGQDATPDPSAAAQVRLPQHEGQASWSSEELERRELLAQVTRLELYHRLQGRLFNRMDGVQARGRSRSGRQTERQAEPFSETEERLLSDLSQRVLDVGQQIAQIDRRLAQMMGRNEAHRKVVELVGPAVGAVLFARLGRLRDYPGAEALEIACGLQRVPRRRAQAGVAVRITRRGARQVRSYLAQAASSWIQRDPVVRAWYQQRSGDAEATRQLAAGAVMKKLVRALWHAANGEQYEARRLFDARR